MQFKYTARPASGELQTGKVEAMSRDATLNILSQHGLFVLEIVQASADHWYDSFASYFNRVKSKDLVIFTRQFSTLLESKISLGDSLRTLYKQTGNLHLKEVIFDLSADIEAGLSLSQALDKFPKVFSEFYVNMIRSAEVTGRMDEIMTFLADYLEKEYGLASRVRNALIYPAVVVGLFVLVAGLMVTVVLPAIAPIFAESNVTLPIFTRVLLAVAKFSASWWWAVVLFMIVIVLFLLDYTRTPEGQAQMDEAKTRLPLIGNMLKKLYVARLSEAISVLIQGGIPITQAVEIASHTVANAVYRDLLHEVAERINAGESMSQAFSRNPIYFPPILTQMTAVGESTGRLEEVLKKVSKFYTQEVDGLVSSLVELIQPALMLGIGLMVGLLFAAILLPLYDLAKTF